MSDQEKSSIVSASVSLGTKKQQDVPHKKAEVPWHILICSNFGYASEKPEPVCASTLNEFIASHNVVLRGTIDSVIAGKPVFIEYPVNDFKDFTSDIVQEKLSFTADLHFLGNTLKDLLKGATPREKILDLLKERGNNSPIFIEALQLISDVGQKPQAPPRQEPASPLKGQSGKEKSNILDSIMGSVATEQVSDETIKPATPTTPVEHLTEALTEGTTLKVPKQKIQSIIERIESQLKEDMTTLLKQQFFSNKKSSWVSCKHLAKIIGRRETVTLSIYSVSFSEIKDIFPEVINSLVEQGNTPDIILFDYPFQITNAHADILSSIGGQAEKYNAIVCTHLSQQEPVIERIPHSDTIKPFFEEPTCIPYKRLRSNSFARTLCLVAPHGVIESGDIDKVSAGGAWLVLFALVQKICDGRSPFDGTVSLADMGITAEFPLRHSAGMTGDHTQEAADMGLTLLSDKTATQAGIQLMTTIDSDTAAPNYTSFAYNLLVNRLLKITTSVIKTGAAEGESMTDCLRKEIIRFLDDQRLLHSENEVEVIQKDGECEVTIDSQKTVDTYQVRIQYSVQL